MSRLGRSYRGASVSAAVITVFVVMTLVHGPLMAALPVTAPFPVAPTLPIPPGLFTPPLFAAPVASVVVPAVVIMRQQRGRM